MKIEQSVCYFVYQNKNMYMRISTKEWYIAVPTGWSGVSFSPEIVEELELDFRNQQIEDFNSDKNA